MPTFLDLYRDRLDAGGITEDQYLATDPGNFVDQLEAQWDAAFAPDKALYSDRALSDRYDEALQIYEKNTGQKLENPYRSVFNIRGQDVDLSSPFRQSPYVSDEERAQKRRQVDEALLQARQQYPDIPDVTQFDQEIADRSTALRAKADRLSQESVGYGRLGAFIGSAAGETVNPINLAALPFGGGPTAARTILGRILVTAGREGGLNAGAQVVVETLDYGSRKKFGTEQSFDEAAGNVLTAFGGGVILGGGGRGAGEAYKAAKSFLFGPARKVASEAQQAAAAKAAQGERPSLPERDATIVLEGEAFDEAAQGERLRLPTGGIQDVLPHENLKRGREAAARVLDTGEDVPAAMYRSDLGEITFNFGEPGNAARKYKGGSGLSHVREKRTNIDGIDGDKFTRETLPEVLAYGKLESLYNPGSARRALITYKGNEVSLSLYRNDSRETWVITGYKSDPAYKNRKGPGGTGGSSPSQPYAPTPRYVDAAEGAGPEANIQSSVFQRNIFTPAGRQVEVEYDLADAANLISSHDDNLNINAAFPSELQPRDRTRAASEAQITNIAGNLAPERLAGGADAGTGAPIIGPDGVVESGNGRVLAIRRAYRNHPEGAKRYRDYLESLGFDTTGIEAPVLVRRRTTALSPEERVAFAREANESATLTLGASERAAADARALPVSALELYRGGDINLARNRDFVKQFMNVIPESERGAILTKDGELSQAGIKRIESALLFKAYGDSGLVAKLTESPDNDIKAIGGALTDIAPSWAQMRAQATKGEIVPEMDITADLLAAVRTVEKARAEGHKVGDLIAQGGLFGEGISEKASLVLRSFYRDANFTRAAGRDAVAQRLAGYIDEANKAVPGPNLLGLDPVAPEQILARQTAPNETPVTGNLFAQPKPQAPDLPVTEHGAAAPDMNAALYADVERVLADKDFEIAIEQVERDGQSLTKTISARDYLKQLDEGIRAAAEVAACAELKGTTA